MFFGETIPSSFHCISAKDLKSKCKVIIIAGSPLQVGGSVQNVLTSIDRSVKRIFINREPIIPIWSKTKNVHKSTIIKNIRRGNNISIGNCKTVV